MFDKPSTDPMIGKKFGRLSVLSFFGFHKFPSGPTHRKYVCVCDCGNSRVVFGNLLKSGHTNSCGCYQRQRRIKSHTKHGHTKAGVWSPLYGVWRSMLQRCNDPKSTSYERYGARGIRIEWQIFDEFVRDMGASWEDGKSIERIDNNGNYSKQNCRWATDIEQTRNKRNNRNIEFQGKTQCAADWDQEMGYPRNTVGRRIRLGWSPEKAITHSIRKEGQHV